MKQFFSVLLCLFVIGVVSQTATAQERGNDEPRVSPNATVGQTIGTTEIQITYGRPGVRDREIFGGLEAFGEVWRTGANEATTVTLSDDVIVEGESLEAGTYSLFTIPGEGEWTIIFNSVANQWGAFDYDESEDIIRVSTESEESFHVEQMMIYFEDVTENSGELVIHWDDTRVPVTIETAGGM